MLYIIIISLLSVIAIGCYFILCEYFKYEVTTEFNNHRSEGDISVIPKKLWIYPSLKVVTPIYATFALIISLYASFSNVSNGNIGIETFGGKAFTRSYTEGLYLLAPWTSIVELDGHLYTVNLISGGDEKNSTIAITKDQNTISVDVSFSLVLNQYVAWKIYQKIGGTVAWHDQVTILGRSAIRDAAAKYTWSEACSTKIGDFSNSMRESFEQKIIDHLVSIGFTVDEAKGAFTISPVQLRKALPDNKIQEAMAAEAVATEELKRQQTITEISALEATRRSLEGTGIKNMFSELPKNITPELYVAVMNASSEHIKAEAIAKAVEKDKVTMVIANGNNVTVTEK